QGFAQPGRGDRVPHLVRRLRRPGDPREVRVPAAAVVTDVARDRAAAETGAMTRRRSGPRTSLASVSVLVLAGAFTLFLALPIVTLIVRSILNGSLLE